MILDFFPCPHCKEWNNTIDWTEDWEQDGDEFDVECRYCKEHFRVKANISISYDLKSND